MAKLSLLMLRWQLAVQGPGFLLKKNTWPLLSYLGPLHTAWSYARGAKVPDAFIPANTKQRSGAAAKAAVRLLAEDPTCSDEACPRDGHDHSSLYFTATSDFWRTVMASYLGDQGMKDRVDGSEDVGRAALATGYNVDQQPAQADASMTAQANFFSARISQQDPSKLLR